MGISRKCAPPTCGFCLAVGEIDKDTGQCVDRAACAERYWRVNAKRADFEKDAILRMQLNQLNDEKYEHHNESCDYISGRWVCSASCVVTYGVY